MQKSAGPHIQMINYAIHVGSKRINKDFGCCDNSSSEAGVTLPTISQEVFLSRRSTEYHLHTSKCDVLGGQYRSTGATALRTSLCSPRERARTPVRGKDIKYTQSR